MGFNTYKCLGSALGQTANVISFMPLENMTGVGGSPFACP